MANHKNAQKAIRKSIKTTALRKVRLSRIKTMIRKLETAIAAKDVEAARSSFVVAQKEIMRGAKKNLFKLNTASRKISKLNQKVKAIAS